MHLLTAKGRDWLRYNENDAFCCVDLRTGTGCDDSNSCGRGDPGSLVRTGMDCPGILWFADGAKIMGFIWSSWGRRSHPWTESKRPPRGLTYLLPSPKGHPPFTTRTQRTFLRIGKCFVLPKMCFPHLRSVIDFCFGRLGVWSKKRQPSEKPTA